MRNCLPHLLTGKGKDGSQQSHQTGKHQIHGSLGTAARLAVCFFGIYAILGDIDIKLGKLGGAEITNAVCNGMELIAIVCLTHLTCQIVHCGKDPLIDLVQRIQRHHIGVWIKIIQIGNENTNRVTDLAVSVGQLLEDQIGHAHVHAVIRGSHPQTHQICTVLSDHVHRGNNVAQGFVHCLAVAIYHPTVGQNSLVRSLRLAASTDGSQQRGLEPSAVLIRAFQIQIGRPNVFILILHHRKVRGAGVKPTVQSIGLLHEVNAAAMGAGKALGQKLCGTLFVPHVGAVLTKQSGNTGNGFVVENGLSAILAIEHGNGQTPMTLTGDTPIGTLAHHLLNAVSSPLGQPFNLFTSLYRLVFEGVYRAEPLGSCTEDDGIFASPAVRILMLKLLGSKERTGLLHICQNGVVGFVIAQSRKLARVGGLIAAVIHGYQRRQTVAAASDVVICTKSACGMNASRTAVHGNVISNGQKAVPIQEGMLGSHVLKKLTGIRCHDLIILNVALCHGIGGKRLRYHIILSVICLDHRIGFGGIKGDCLVTGQGPGSRCPDDEVGLGRIAYPRQLACVVLDAELDINGGTLIGLVFDLCLCQSSLVVGAPVNRL